MKTISLVCILLVSIGCSRKSGPPYGPKDALKTLKIVPGYRIETFTSEPNVVSPVAMDVDENGSIYVVEDRAYPLNVKGHVGRVKMLRDTDGDGYPDKATVFAEGLVLPTGVMRWKKGILVTDAPDVWYFEDTDGDGKADVKTKVLTGFPFTNPQHTANGPVYGLDNWIYIAHEHPATAVVFKKEFGDRGSSVRFVDREGGPSLYRPGHNVRFRPDTGQLEALSSSSQFGQSFDDYGRHFLVGNSNHVRMEAIAERYLSRNPDLPIGNAMDDISDHGATAKVFPITEHPRFEMLSGVGEFTSACGIFYYRGSTFTAEPVHNIIHQDRLSENGSLYLAKRAQQSSEFLASTDSWFRPVNMYTGPDGAMYVMDYYRMVIEHPEWMASDTYNSPDLYKGVELGRIYRIVPDGVAEKPVPVHLGSASDAELVKQLENPIIWWRRTAQRLLVDRKAVGAAPAIAALFSESKSPQGRVHALWTLEGLGKLDSGLVQKALSDPEPGVRENAIILAEERLGAHPELAKQLLTMTDDMSARVRYQLVLTLGNVKSPASQQARDRMLFHDLGDKWLQVAALSADSADAPRLFEKAIAAKDVPSDGREALVRNVSAIVATRQKPAEIDRLLSKVAAGKTEAAGNWRAASLDGLNRGLRAKHGTLSPHSKQTLLAIFETSDPAVRHAALTDLEAAGLPEGSAGKTALAHAESVAKDEHADAAFRADSIGLLAMSDPDSRADLFKSLIDTHEPEPVEVAAIRAYGRVNSDTTGQYLIEQWRNFTPAARTVAGDALVRDPGRQKLLLAALKAGNIQPWMLTFGQKNRFIMNQDPAVRAEARPILEQTQKDHEAVVKKYEPALDMTPDIADGKHIFDSVCSKCHRFNGVGHDVGPDLGTVRNQPKQVLLTNILMPSKSIAQGFESYVVETNSGGNYDGVIGPQTPTTITLKHEDGKEDVIQRQDIKTMYATNLSAMPGDLEKQISVKQMAGVLEFLKKAQ
jgi:putative membrane-bound dehydrogenase-like protein